MFDKILPNKKKFHNCYSRFNKISKVPNKKNHIVKNGYFANADMRCGHDGLQKMAQTRNIDLENLWPGQLVVFVNTKQDRVKVFTTGHMFSYLKMPSGQRINPGVISLIPKFYSGGRIQYDKALKQVFKKQFGME
jgi:hypothetical protein